MQRHSLHWCHVHIHMENSLLSQGATGYYMVIKVLPLLCAQSGPASQVTSDGPTLWEGCHFCPTNLRSSWETKLSCACCHFHTSLCEQAGGMSEYFMTGIEGGTQLPSIRICNINISGALHRTLVPPSIWKEQEMFEDMEWWPHPRLPVAGWWTCENTLYQIQRWGLNNAVTGNICDLWLIRQEEETG